MTEIEKLRIDRDKALEFAEKLRACNITYREQGISLRE